MLEAINDIWVQIHGPMKEFIMDGERGIAVAERAKEYFQHHGIQYQARAPEQHARHIERRGALLRDQIDRTEPHAQT